MRQRVGRLCYPFGLGSDRPHPACSPSLRANDSCDRQFVFSRAAATAMVQLLPTVDGGLDSGSQVNAGLLQIDGLVTAVLVELSAPYLMQALMLGWTKADGCSKPHVEITHCFERFDQLLGVELPTGAF